MNKEEILAKSRLEQNDEGIIQAEHRGRKYGLVAFSIVFIIITFVNLFKGQSNYGPMAMFWAFLAAESYPKYKFTNQKAYLISTIAGTIASIAYVLSFLMDTNR